MGISKQKAAVISEGVGKGTGGGPWPCWMAGLQLWRSTHRTWTADKPSIQSFQNAFIHSRGAVAAVAPPLDSYGRQTGRK